MRTRTQLQKEIGFLLIIKNKTNKNNPVGEKTDCQAGQVWTRLDRAGQDTRHTSNDDEPTQNCKHKEIIKGANEEGNEGKQLGKINQKQVTRWVGSRQIDMRANYTQKTRIEATCSHKTKTQAHGQQTNHQPCAKQDTNTQLMRKLISHVFTQDMTT